MYKEEAEKMIKETIEYANREIKKSKNKYLKMYLTISGILIIAIISYLLVFKFEIPVEYSNDILKVNMPADKGIDIKINLENYRNANAVLIKTDENTYDLYVNVTQTLSTKIFRDNDKSDHLLRVGNNLVMDFQSEKIKDSIPDEYNDENIMNIYYIDNLPNKIKTTENNELSNYNDKILVWKRN